VYVYHTTFWFTVLIRFCTSLPSRLHLQRVLHCSNLAPGISHTDIAAALQAFGRPLFAMLLPNRSQYLIEMSSVEEASNIVYASAASPIFVLGRPIRTQFSRSQEITRATAIPLDPHAASLVSNSRPATLPGASGRVLLISIQHAIHPISVDVLEKILRPYGDLLRVVVFEKERGVQALAEFRFPQEAEAALVALQGREIYDRCCRLSIIVSKNDTVNVRENSETQRDFTNPSLPTRSGVSVPGSSNSGSFVAGAGLPGYGAAPYGMGFGASGMSQAGSLPFQHGDRFDAPGHRPAFPGPVSRGSYDNGPRDAYDGRGGGPVGASPVVMVYNLPTPDVWPGFCHEHVFNLFSCFGDVLRVRLLSKPGSGMIEFANPRMVRASFTSLKMRLSPSLFAGESRC
jgi:hnRNP-L/PTB/hephaestus splicing factor